MSIEWVSSPPTDFHVSLLLPLVSLSPVFEILEQPLLEYQTNLPESDTLLLDIPIGLKSELPEYLFLPTGLISRFGHVTPWHIDGACNGGFLTLILGEKYWEFKKPGTMEYFSTTQSTGETVFIPPGWIHQVTTLSSLSVGYGAFWTSPVDEQFTLLCKNRDFIRRLPLDHKKGLIDDFAPILEPLSSASTPIEGLLQAAGKKTAVKKGGSTRRTADGRKRKKTHLSLGSRKKSKLN